MNIGRHIYQKMNVFSDIVIFIIKHFTYHIANSTHHEIIIYIMSYILCHMHFSRTWYPLFTLFSHPFAKNPPLTIQAYPLQVSLEAQMSSRNDCKNLGQCLLENEKVCLICILYQINRKHILKLEHIYIHLGKRRVNLTASDQTFDLYV